MRRRVGRGAALLVAALSFAATGCSRNGAEWVFRGGRVYTADAQRRVAEAVAVDGGRIIYVGDAGGAAPLIGGGKGVAPHLQRTPPSFQQREPHFAHVHISSNARTRSSVLRTSIVEAP